MAHLYSYRISGIDPSFGRFEVRTNRIKWIFEPLSISRGKYLSLLNSGSCEPTYTADCTTALRNESHAFKTIHSVNLLLSFLFARTVTVMGPSIVSDGPQCRFSIRPRNIAGFKELTLKTSLQSTIDNYIKNLTNSSDKKMIMLMLSHWLNGISCYTLEDILLSMATIIEMVPLPTGIDHIFKNRVIQAASVGKYRVFKNHDKWITNLRVNLVHFGDFCADRAIATTTKPNITHASLLISELLNILDAYMIFLTAIDSDIQLQKRWNRNELYRGVPSVNTII